MKAKAEFLASVFDPELFPQPYLPEIAFLGRSNVGKSSLINVLLGEKNLARTSSQPGKTASINFYGYGGVHILVDLPGFGYAKVPKATRLEWGDLIETYFKTRPYPVLVFVLVDSRRKIEQEELYFLDWLQRKGIPRAIILSKIDKLKKEEKKKAKLAAESAGALYEATVFLFSKEDKASAKDIFKEITKEVERGPSR